MSLFTWGQTTEGQMAHCEDPDFNKKVNKLLNYTVDVISVSELQNKLDDYIILDARELNEFLVSRIPGAVHFGYDDPKWQSLENIAKDQPIVVYCSIGYRSEKIGEKLQKKGFTDVHNLYGSIFEWANQNCIMEDPRGNTVKTVHGYNKKWSKWVKNEGVEVVY